MRCLLLSMLPGCSSRDPGRYRIFNLVVVVGFFMLSICDETFAQSQQNSPFTGSDSVDLARFLARANAFQKESPTKRDRVAKIAWSLMAADAAVADDTQLYSLATDLFERALRDWDILEKELKENPSEAEKLLREDKDFAMYIDLIRLQREEIKKTAQLSREQERSRLDLLRNAIVQYRDICNQLASAHTGLVFGDADAATKSAEDAIERYKALEAAIKEPRAFWLFDKEPIVASNRQDELTIVLTAPKPIFPNMEAHTGSVAALSMLTMADRAEDGAREGLLRAAIQRAESSIQAATPEDKKLHALLTYVKAAANKRLIFDDIVTTLDDGEKRKTHRAALAELAASLQSSLTEFEANDRDFGQLVTRCEEDLRHLLADDSALARVSERISAGEIKQAFDELITLAVFADSPRVGVVLSFLASSTGQHQQEAQRYIQYLISQGLPIEAEQEVKTYSAWLNVAKEVSKDNPDAAVIHHLSKELNAASTVGKDRWLQCWAIIGRSACDATLLASFQNSPLADQIRKTSSDRLEELRNATSELSIRFDGESSVMNRQLMQSQLMIGFAAEAAMAARFDADYYDASQVAATNSLRLSTRSLPQPEGLDLLGSALNVALTTRSGEKNGELVEEERILRFATNSISQSMLALLVTDPETASGSIGETVKLLNLVESATAVDPRAWYKKRGVLPRAQADAKSVRSDALAASAIVHAQAGKIPEAVLALQALAGPPGDLGKSESAHVYTSLRDTVFASPLEDFAASYVGYYLLQKLQLSSNEQNEIVSVARQKLSRCLDTLQASHANAERFRFLSVAANQLSQELNNPSYYTEQAKNSLALMQSKDAGRILELGLLVFPDDDTIQSLLLKVELTIWRSGQSTNFTSSTRQRVNATRDSHGLASATAFQLGQVAEAMNENDKATFWYSESVRLSKSGSKETVLAGARLAVINATR